MKSLLPLTLLFVSHICSADPLPARFQSCMDCHGITGTSAKEEIPNLAGQRAAYLEDSLKGFRAGTRKDFGKGEMQRAAEQLEDADIQILVDYYSKQTVALKSPNDPAQVERGHELYARGVEARSIPSCVHCHGLIGQGVKADPRMAGQNKKYLVQQMELFQSGARVSTSEPMNRALRGLGADEIDALASFLESLNL